MAKAKTKSAVKRKPAKPQARAAAPSAAKAPKKAATTKPASKTAKASVVSKPAKTAARITADVKPVAKPVAQPSTERLTLPAAKPAEPPVVRPAPVVRKAEALTASLRADLPPADGFTLLVDGHFKNQFGDLKGAKAAASELKTRFPMLRIEIYDAAKKERLPA